MSHPDEADEMDGYWQQAQMTWELGADQPRAETEPNETELVTATEDRIPF
jgi:hypothetical protein